MTREKPLIDVFMEAASRFRDLAKYYHGSNAEMKSALMDKANEVFLARDSYGAQMPKNGAEWAAVCMEVDDVKDFLQENDIHMNNTPVQTSTGRTTYRIITPSRTL